MLLTVSMARGVQLSANGQGQVLIYPYYTVRDAPDTGTPFNTLVSVVNGTLEGKVVRVRFREARRGAPVFEANVFLSPRDVWTAAVIPWQGGAALVSTDNTCTQPSIKVASGSPPSAVFYPDRYLTDGGGTTIGRTRDGYIEVLEMGTVRNPSALYSATVHILGVASCLLPGQEQIPSNLDPPSGGLYGTGTLINVLEGAAYAYDAVALERRADIHGAWRRLTEPCGRQSFRQHRDRRPICVSQPLEFRPRRGQRGTHDEPGRG